MIAASILFQQSIKNVRTPDAYPLILIGQMLSPVVVIALDCAGGRVCVEEVLSAAGGSKVGVGARVLADLRMHRVLFTL